MPAAPRFLARGALLAATATWGATFVVVQRALADLPVFHLLAYRFTLGTLVLLPLLARSRLGARLLRDGLPVGLALFAGYAFQTFGLLWTTPSRSAFLTGLSVLVVPALAWSLGRHRLGVGQVAGAACAAAGLYLLYQPAGGGPPFGRGDLITLGCTLAFAVHVLLVERAVRRHPVTSLAVVQFLAVAVLSAPSLILSPPGPHQLTANAVSAVLVTGVLATALAFLCQLYAQRHLSAVETAVFLTLEPLFAALASLLLRAEPWRPSLASGGGLVLAAMLLAQLGPPRGAPSPPGFAPPRA